ncbi:MAG TPA: hypothetical protein VK157_02070, partial [Phycisphaerales bacterium]|nr:hypothetical protein [Phycisphaerales bacterium]
MLKLSGVLVLLAGTMCTTVIAQPTLTSLGGGSASNITNAQGGVIYLGGQSGSQAVRWNFNPSAGTLTSTLIGGIGGGEVSLDGQASTVVFTNTGPSIRGNTAATVSPAFNTNPTLVASTTLPADGEPVSRWWSSATNTVTSMGGLPIVGSLGVFGSGSSGGTTGNFLSGHGISSTGQYVVGQAYISTFTNNNGTAITANSFRWRPYIWNSATGTHTVLPTPLRTTSNTNLRRTGNAYAVSTDGTVVVGATEHNVGGSTDDSGRLCVWRFNAGTNSYDLTYLNDGRVSTTPSSVAMNSGGTIIVGRGESGINKWTWNAGTSTWDRVTLFTGLTPTPSNTYPSWLPGSVLAECAPGVPGPAAPNLGSVIAMNDDASIIVGSASWSTCGSFIAGGFIYTAASGVAQDWHDYLASINAPGVTPGGLYGPIGVPGDATRGNPRSGSPVAISPDGNNVLCQILGPQFIAGAQPYILNFTGGPTCVAPAVSSNPNNATFSACSSGIILNASASGTGPFTYQWFKDGVALTDGTTLSGSIISGAADLQLRVNPPLTPADAGSYYAVITGQCGSP